MAYEIGSAVSPGYGGSEFKFYLDAPKAPLKVPKHFMRAICSLINSPSKLCCVEEHAAKRAFATVSFEPSDSLIDLLTTFRARNFQRQIVEKHGLVLHDEQTFLIASPVRQRPRQNAASSFRLRYSRIISCISRIYEGGLWP
jgi:hypothetical protein